MTFLIFQLINLPQYIKSHRIAVYLSMPDEVFTMDIIKHIFASNKLCFIPQYDKNDMKMLQLYSLSDYENLPQTKWNIKQPAFEDINRPNALFTGISNSYPIK